MGIFLSLDAKSNISLVNETKGSAGLTWDEADWSWDEAEGTWDNPKISLSLSEIKSNISLSNESK